MQGRDDHDRTLPQCGVGRTPSEVSMARLVTVFLAVTLILGQAGIALAAPASGFRGLSLSTLYPAQTVRAGERVTLTLTMKNFGLSPQPVALRVAEVPRGWKAAILG